MSELTTKQPPKGITGSTLKWIAIIIMLIDHAGVILIGRILMSLGMMDVTDAASAAEFMQQNSGFYYTYFAMRLIGRIAFPIFCFLLVEGLMHTRNVKKYITRLFLFALISEIPFDIGIFGTAFYWDNQNVFFTLFIGISVIAGMKLVEQKTDWNKLLRIFLNLAIIAIGGVAANYLKSDYGTVGVLTIVGIYLFRARKVVSAFVGCAVLQAVTLMELPAFLAILPISRYNGQRGQNLKWLFYAFYPLHILILYLITCAMGLGSFPAML